MTNPYEPPSTPAPLHEAPIDWRRTVAVFAGWLIGASLVAGAMAVLRIGFALRMFDAQVRIASITAIEALRVSGAHVAASAAALGVFAGVHRHLSARSGWDGTRAAAPLLAIVPFAGLCAAGILVGSAMVVARLVFEVPFGASWNGMGVVTSVDVLVGAIRACAFALVVALLVGALGPSLARWRGRLIPKLACVLIGTRAATLVADLGLQLLVS